MKLRAGEAFELPELGGEAIEPRLFVSTYHDTSRSSARAARRDAAAPDREPERALAAQAAAWDRPTRARGGGQSGRPARDHDRSAAGLSPRRRARARRAATNAAHRRSCAGRRDRPRQRLGARQPARLPAASRSSRSSCSRVTRRRCGGSRRRCAGPAPATARARPKVFQALDLEFERRPRRAGERRSAPASSCARSSRFSTNGSLAHDPGTRLGTDPEELHQFRVATRRLRAFLRAGRELLDPAWAEPLREELRWLGGALGPVRDLDVLIERLAVEVETLGDRPPRRPQAR